MKCSRRRFGARRSYIYTSARQDVHDLQQADLVAIADVSPWWLSPLRLRPCRDRLSTERYWRHVPARSSPLPRQGRRRYWPGRYGCGRSRARLAAVRHSADTPLDSETASFDEVAEDRDRLRLVFQCRQLRHFPHFGKQCFDLGGKSGPNAACFRRQAICHVTRPCLA